MPVAGHASEPGCAEADGACVSDVAAGGGATRSTWPGDSASLGDMWFQLATSCTRCP